MLIFGGLAFILSITDTSSAPRSSTASPGDEQARESQWVYNGKQAVRSRLKDPDSATFQNVFFNRGADGLPVACGEVNSKNAFGAYAGFERFVYAGSAANTYLASDVEGGEAGFNTIWIKFCQG